jgi:hypothetical protein
MAATSIRTRSPRAADRLVLVPTQPCSVEATTPVFHRLGGMAVNDVARAQRLGDQLTCPCVRRRTPAVFRPSGARRSRQGRQQLRHARRPPADSDARRCATDPGGPGSSREHCRLTTRTLPQTSRLPPSG